VKIRTNANRGCDVLARLARLLRAAAAPWQHHERSARAERMAEAAIGLTVMARASGGPGRLDSFRRHAFLRKWATGLRATGVTQVDALDHLEELNRSCCPPPVDDEALFAVVREEWGDATPAPLPYPLRWDEAS
jgi:hypothetical protein